MVLILIIIVVLVLHVLHQPILTCFQKLLILQAIKHFLISYWGSLAIIASFMSENPVLFIALLELPLII